MNVLIIGSEGFIGSHCVNFFTAKGYTVSGCDLHPAPSTNYNYFQVSRISPSYNELFKNANYSLCINCAGNGSVPVSLAEPFMDFEANVSDTFRILDAVKNFNPTCKYLNISSAAVYGNPKKLPVKENAAIRPLSPYGFHKHLSELLCVEFSTLYNIPTASVRPFSVYGPGLKKQIIWDIFWKMKASDKIELFGTGKETRDFIFIEDFILALNKIIEKGKFNGAIYNIANGKSITIKTVATSLAAKLDYKGSITFTGETRAGDPSAWQAEISKIKTFGYKQHVSLEKGISITIEWLKKQAKIKN